MAKVIIRDDIVIKVMSADEMDLQSRAAALGLAPRIIRARYLRNGYMRVIMERIHPMCVCDMYGYDEEDIPEHIWKGAQKIVRKLYQVGIEYRDITGYNFIEDEYGKLWVIDFEHARRIGRVKSRFVREFMQGRNNWNPHFA